MGLHYVFWNVAAEGQRSRGCQGHSRKLSGNPLRNEVFVVVKSCEVIFEPWSKLLKEGYIRGYTGDYYRGY